MNQSMEKLFTIPLLLILYCPQFEEILTPLGENHSKENKESIHGEVVHNSSSIDSSLLPNVQRTQDIDTPGRKAFQGKDRTQIAGFDGLKTISAPFPPRQ